MSLPPADYRTFGDQIAADLLRWFLTLDPSEDQLRAIRANGPGQHLIVSVELPVIGHITHASADEPFLAAPSTARDDHAGGWRARLPALWAAGRRAAYDVRESLVKDLP